MEATLGSELEDSVPRGKIFGQVLPESAAVMSGGSGVLSSQQSRDIEFVKKKVMASRGNWPFENSWYFPMTGPKLSEASAVDPTKFLSIPVLLFMPVLEFSNRFDRCPCASYGYEHNRVVSNGFTEPCRVVGASYTYAMLGNRYSCLDCKDSNQGTYTFNSYDERLLAYLPPDIR